MNDVGSARLCLLPQNERERVFGGGRLFCIAKNRQR
jgi:hypothetical protein